METESTYTYPLIYKRKIGYRIGGWILVGAIVVFLVWFMIYMDSDKEMYPHYCQLIFVNLIFLTLIACFVTHTNEFLIKEIIIFPDRLVQNSDIRKPITIAWEDVTKVKYSGDSFYVYSNDAKICISIRIKDIERFVECIRDHLDSSLTEKAFYKLEARTYIRLK